MGAEPTLEQWNFQYIALSQALLGMISPNIRMVWLNYEEDVWVIHFTLNQDDASDRQEIDDAVIQFEAFQDRSIACRIEVLVQEGALDWPASPARVVFRRRD